MKKFLFVGVAALFLLGSCQKNSKPAATQAKVEHKHENCSHDHDHEGHDHAKTEHKHDEHANCNHDHEGHDHAKSEHKHDEHANCTHDHEGHDHGDAEHKHDDHEGHNHDGHDHDHGHEGASDEIVISPEKAAAAGIASMVIKPGTFNHVIKTSGQVLAAQGDEATAVSTIAGVVTFRHKLTEGMSINKGGALLTVSANNLADGDPVKKARIAYEAAKKEYERMKPLVESKIVSEKDFSLARREYEDARVSFEAVSKNHSAAGQAITAPIAGFVKSILVKEGDYVEVGQPLVSITQNKHLFLRAEVSEKHYAQLRNITSANFKTPYDNTVYHLQDLGGRMLAYGKTAANNSYYIPVTFEFDNRGDVLPGSFVEIYLLAAPMPAVLSLPHSALTEEQGSHFVYLQLDDECYKKQEVKLGADNGSHVQITAGIHPGERVVTQGAYQVKLASASNALPAHTHEH